jgi:hypothetical protein
MRPETRGRHFPEVIGGVIIIIEKMIMTNGPWWHATQPTPRSGEPPYAADS